MPRRPSLSDFRAVCFDIDGARVDSKEMSFHPKPDPENALLACRHLNVDPTDVLLVGDSAHDMQCARRAGKPCVAVAYRAGDREKLIAEDPDLLFDTPEELLQLAPNAFLLTSCPERS